MNESKESSAFQIDLSAIEGDRYELIRAEVDDMWIRYTYRRGDEEHCVGQRRNGLLSEEERSLIASINASVSERRMRTED